MKTKLLSDDLFVALLSSIALSQSICGQLEIR